MFEIAWPYAFLLLPLPFLVIRFFPACKQQTHHALRVPFYREIQPFISSTTIEGRHYLTARLLIWLLLVFALSGPQWVGQPKPIKQEGRNIMLALDLSGSMRIKDMEINDRSVTRLAVVKKTATQFVKERIGDRLGLILFGTRAYLQTPLTFDRKTVLHMLNDATVGLAGQTTSIGDAIGLAVKRLDKTDKKSRVLVLLTDGVSNSGVLTPKQAARIAKSYHIKIYTIGLGAEKMIVQSLFGPRLYNPSQDLDERELRAIAKLTGGQFFRATDYKQLRQVYHTINKLEPVKADSKIIRPKTDYYYIPLALAFFIFLWLGFLPLFRTLPLLRAAGAKNG
jgi:Ca-activated chloride channel family protein